MPALGGAVAADRPPTHQLEHQPALDGLRGLAVAAVVVYHLDGDVLPGGFLGVSLFFTLSGFLITNVVLAGARRSGTVGILNFWKRRILRLLPAAMVGIALAIALTYFYGSADQVGRLRGDVAASLGYVQNWHQINNGDVYGAAYLEPSSLQHFWSLAIEEQFYVLYPLLAWLLVRLRATRQAWLWVLGGLTAVSLIAQLALFHGGDVNRVYLGSETRASEILIGAMLAVVIRMRAPAWLRTLAAQRWALAVLALPVLVMGLLWAWTKQTDAWLYRGGLVAVAVVSAAALTVVLTPGPIARVFSWRPLCWLGSISYGVYLYHWPIFIAMTARRTGLSAWPLAIARVVATVVVATLSAYLIELPIRRGRFSVFRNVVNVPRLVLAGTLPFLVIGLLWASNAAEARAETRAVDMRTAARIRPRPSPVTPTATTTTTATTIPDLPVPVEVPPTSAPVVPPVRRVLFMGDSLVHQSSTGLSRVFADQGIEMRAVGASGQTLLSHRDQWLGGLSDTVDSFDPDVVVLEACCGYGPNAFRAGYPAPDGRVLPLDSRDLYLEWAAVAEQATAIASARGALALWVLAPPARPGSWFGSIDQRIPIVNAIYTALSACEPQIGLVDWRVLAAADGSYTDTLLGIDNVPILVRNEDGLHFTPAGIGVIATATLDAIDAAWSASGGRRGALADLATRCPAANLVA